MGATTSSTNQANTTSSLSRSNTLNNADRKNRNLASTIKKRFSKRNRRLDYSKIIKEFLKIWSTDNLIQLVNDYESSSVIKEFYLQSELARPIASNVSRDLRKLYDNAICSDAYIQFKDKNFPVHKSIVCSRCPLFRGLFSKVYTFGAVVPIQLDLQNEITTELFSDLLRYLYTGEIDCNLDYGDNELKYKNLFKNLSNHVPNQLEYDLKHLLDTGLFCDIKLVFKNSKKRSKRLNDDMKCTVCSNNLSEYSCHAAILASRSRFFRNLILKYQSKNCLKNENQSTNSSKQSIRIVLDESYIQKRYINIVLNSIYCDGSDILSLLPNCVCKCTNLNRSTNSNLIKSTNLQDNTQQDNSLNNTLSNTLSNLTGSSLFQTISNTISPATTDQTNASIRPENYLNELIDLFVIGRFLELDQLISICETLIAVSINLDTIIQILDFSEKSNCSEFVRRQALCFLREEFSSVATSQILFKLNENQLIELIKSDFLQASEYEVMCAILKWIEFKTDNYNNKYGSNLENLKLIINRLFKYVRIGHILPLENDVLKNLLKNNLIFNLPAHMLNNDQTDLNYERSNIMEWINLENRINFLKPRFFQIFYEESKLFLEERLIKCEEIGNFNDKITIKKHHHLQMPDNLYMIDDSLNKEFKNLNCSNNLNQLNKNLFNLVDLDLNADRLMIRNLKESIIPIRLDIDYLGKETKNLIKQKSTENYLKILSSIKSLNLKEKYEILIYIQLKVLRENNLPDEMIFIFEEDDIDLTNDLNNLSLKEKKIDLDINLNLNLRKRDSKRKKFSLNSIDLENYLDLDHCLDDNQPLNEEDELFYTKNNNSFNGQFDQIFSNSMDKQLKNVSNLNEKIKSTTNQFNELNQISDRLLTNFNHNDLPGYDQLSIHNQSQTTNNDNLLNQLTNQLPDINQYIQDTIEPNNFVNNLDKEISLDILI